MKKLLATMSTIAVLSLSGAALAEESSGKIEAMDPQSRTIILDDGNTYTVSQDVALESLRPGSEVTVSFEEQGGQKVVTEIEPAN